MSAWKQEIPTAPGWYWYRGSEIAVLTVAEVFEGHVARFLGFKNMQDIRALTGFWQPVEPPKV